MLAQPRRVPRPVRGSRRRPPAGTCTGRATQPRRTPSSLEVARAHGATEVVKVKSLTTDEIELNDALAAGGHPRARDRLRRADPAARRRLVVAHPRPGDPPQSHRDPRPLRTHDRAGNRVGRPARARRGGAGLPARAVPAARGSASAARTSASPRPARSASSSRRATAACARRCRRCSSRCSASRSSCRASPTSRSSSSCCRARRPASG